MFNKVAVTKDHFIKGFDLENHRPAPEGTARLAFTGIQVLNPGLLSLLPENRFYSSIDLYRNMITRDMGVKAFVAEQHYWKDIGTPRRYRETVFEIDCPKAFQAAFQDADVSSVACTQLKGDGSDREWFRLTAGQHSLILADHNIKTGDGTTEADAFISHAQHLRAAGVPVPRIHFQDAFPGLVFLEDLGDTKLQDLILKTGDRGRVAAYYREVIDLLVKMAFQGKKDFDPETAYQTPYYDKALILERECGYFMDAFVKSYLGMVPNRVDFSEDFSYLAHEALRHAVIGFMHRDLQSRNIMFHGKRFYFIDFQGGRLGPVQYDLASLLIDPYVGLPFSEQADLARYCAEQVSSTRRIDKNEFLICYRHCCLTRNLQILGAFGYLSRTKGKKWFEQYIPTAIRSLKHHIDILDASGMPKLKALILSLPD
jgi:aminoglycoside/choline kinase family phosphotransferase